MTAVSTESVTKAVMESIKDALVEGGMQLALECSASAWARASTNSQLKYESETGADSPIGAEEKCASLFSTWRECEVVSFEEPLHLSDTAQLAALKTKISSAMNSMVKNKSATHSYAYQGVGGAEGCILQLVVYQLQYYRTCLT